MKIEYQEKCAHPNLRLRYGTYHADFRVGRRRFRKSLETSSLQMARQRLKELIADVSNGKFDQHRGSNFTVKEWFEEYERTHLPNRVRSSREASVRAFSNVIIPFLGAKTLLAEVSPAALIRLRSEGWGKRKPATQNRMMALIKHFFSEARRRNLIESDPARDIQKLKENSKASRTLSDFELKRLLVASPEPLRSYIKVAAMTGMRRGEIEGLRWKNVFFDPQRGQLWLRLRNDDQFRTKSGRDRDIPVHSSIVDVFSKHAEMNPEELVFKPPLGGKGFYPRREWRRVIKRLGLMGFTFHGLRRTFGTNLHREGVPIGSVQVLMGHSTIQQTRAYVDTQSNDLIDAIGKFDRIAEVVNENQKEVWSRNGHVELISNSK